MKNCFLKLLVISGLGLCGPVYAQKGLEFGGKPAGGVGIGGGHAGAGAEVGVKGKLPAVKVERILFVGNSFTYCNDLPGVLNAMALHGKIMVACDSSVAGAATLQNHWDTPDKAQRLINEHSYKFLVLQDQSATPAIDPAKTMEYAKKFCDLAAQRKTKPVMFLTWAYQQDPVGPGQGIDKAMQKALTATYVRAASANGALLAPVGPAFEACLAKMPKAPLYTTDGQHPASHGTYLAACVFYRTLFGKSPVGLPGKLTLNQTVVCDIPPDQARALQRVAEETCEKFAVDKILAEEQAVEAKLLSQEEFREKIRKGISYAEFVAIVGKPHQSNEQDMTFQFVIKGGVDVLAKFNVQAKTLEQATFLHLRDGRPSENVIE